MSTGTVLLPPEGPGGQGGKDLQQETRPLLSNSHDACDNDSTQTTLVASRTSTPGDYHSPEGQGHVTGENPTYCDPVRTQPQPLPQPTASAQGETNEGGGGGGGGGGGEAARSQNGLRSATGALGLSNGNGIHRGGLAHTHACSCAAAAAARAAAEAGAETQQQQGGGQEQLHRKQPSPVSQKIERKLRSSLSVNSDSSRRSKGSSTGSHKPGTLPEDCCVHCILACLFCEFLTLCNMVVAQASCGTCTSEACCCCCCGGGDDMGDDCNCPCDDMDCGIMDACCESSDCLEICMECCGICFPT